MYEYLAYMSVYVPSAILVPREIEMGVASLEREIKTVGSNHVGECWDPNLGGLKQQMLPTAQPSVSPALEPVCLFVLRQLYIAQVDL